MQDLVLQLFNSKSRPTFSYMCNGIEVMALFDTGADTPVWCKGEKAFIEVYPDARKLEGKALINGFGKNPESASVYIIPEFIIENRNVAYKLANLQVAVCYRPLIGCDFILSETMFSKTDTYIYRIENKRLEILFEKEIYQCSVKSGPGTFSVVTYTQ